MEKKILIILLCGLLAVWPCIPALATEEETTTAEWNIFEDVETVARQTVTSIDQGTEIISKYIAMTTEYSGDIFENLVNEAVNLWQSSGVALTLDYITNGGALDYIVDFGELGALISEYINNNYPDTPQYSNITIGGVTWYYVAPGSSVNWNNGNFRPGVKNDSSIGVYACCTKTSIVACSTSPYSSVGYGNVGLRRHSSYGYSWHGNGDYNGFAYFAEDFGNIFYSNYANTAQALVDFYGGDLPEAVSAVSTPTQYITSTGIGSVNWSSVSTDEGDTYNNIENVYNYITNTGQQLDEASVDQMAAEGATLANIDYSVPNATYDYSFISVAFACLPDEYKSIILLGIVLLVCSILFGFGHGGVK